MAGEVDAGAFEEHFGNRAHADTGRRLAGARALEDVSKILAVVLQASRKIRMPGARASDRRPMRAACVLWRIRLHAHRVLPVHPISIGDGEGHRAAEGLSVSNTRENLRGVALDGHAAAAAVTGLPPAKVGRDVRG